MAKCVFRLKGGKLCGKPGQGNPPICNKHYEEMLKAEEDEEDEDDLDDGPPGFEYVEEIVDVVADHPKVQGVFHKAGSILDRFANAVDMFASGRWTKPPEPDTGPEPTGEAPPRQERRQRQAPPPDPRREQQARLAQALLIFGWPSGKTYTEADVRKRKHELNRVYHPDANGGDDTMAKKVNAAADVLLKAIGK
jgi:hypothetical protein